MAELTRELSRNLAENLRYLRGRRQLTQHQLARLADVPRSTLAGVEAGGGNPTLAVLAGLSAALGVSISELLSPPSTMGRVYKAADLPEHQRGGPVRATIRKLLPDPIPGAEIDRMEIPAGTRVEGVPHRPGTREYMLCEEGTVVLSTGGERLEVGTGDVCAFEGDQRHRYENPGPGPAVVISVVVLSPR
jgi:transcriptional regulator with XRE-family HTH domain